MEWQEGGRVDGPPLEPASLQLVSLGDIDFGGEVGRDRDFGAIYSAWPRLTGTPWQARIVRRAPEMSEDEWRAAKARLAEVLSVYGPLCSCPGVVPLVALGDNGDQVFLFSEVPSGYTLHDLITTRGPQSLGWARTVLDQVAQALDEAARFGAAHTALTPERILIPSDGGRVRLLDFGLSCLRDRRSAYAATEQWQGFPGDTRTDVFASGAILYELLGGRPAFHGRTLDELRSRIETSTTKPILALPEEVRAVLTVMLSPFPGRRYGRLRHAVDDLLANKIPATVSLALAPPENTNAPVSITDERTTGLIVQDGILRKAAPIPVEPSVWAGVKTVSPSQMPRAVTESAYREDVGGKGLEVDRIIAKYREERKKRQEREAAEPRLRKIRHAKRVGWIFAVVFVLGLRLGWLLGDFTAVRVVSARGKPMVQVDGIVRPLLTGDVLKSETPIFLTDNSSSVVLSLRGVLVKLLPSSQLTVQQAEYRSKPIRRFALDKGEARFNVASVSGRSSLFDVVCGGVIARTKAGRFGIRHRPGKKDGAEVLSAAGEVQVITAQMGTQLVIPGTMVSAAPNDTTVPPPLTVSKDIIKSLQEDGDLAGIGNALSAFAAIEEKAMLAVNDGVQNVTGFQITAGMSDAAAHAQASFAMNGLLTLLTDPPPTLDYRTLRPLPLEAEAREKILKCFRGHRLLSYKVLPGGCEVIARAKDSKATVYVARNGAVTKLSEAEAAKRGYGPPTDNEE